MITIARIHRFLRSVFDDEAASGFPRLGRVPDMHVRQFLDYYGSLTVHERSELADASTLWGTHTLRGSVILEPSEINGASERPAGDALEGHAFEGLDIAAMLESNVAWRKWRHEMMNGKHRDRHWYTSVPILRLYRAGATMRRNAGEPPPSDWYAMMEDYAASVHGAKAPALRKLARQLVKDRFAGRGIKGSAGDWTYEADVRGDRVILSIDYGSQAAQLRYSLRAQTAAGTLILSRGFEASLGVGHGDWDFLTEENAGASIGLLGDFMEEIVRWPAQLAQQP